jgi:hypothetical protein
MPSLRVRRVAAWVAVQIEKESELHADTAVGAFFMFRAPL